MIRSFVSCCVVGALVIGCVSIEGLPTAPQSFAIPTSAATLSPIPETTSPATSAPISTSAATIEPRVTPSSEPTMQPTAEATGEPLPEPSPGGVENYGANNPVFDDQMEDPNSGWGTGTNAGGSIAYVDGNLQIDTVAGGAWQYTSRLTGSTDNAAHFEGVYTPSGTGYMGLVCGDSGDVAWGGMANFDTGDFAFLKLEGTGATVLAQGRLEDLKVDPGEISRFALDCAGTATGSFRMQIYPSGTNTGVHYDGAPGEGPTVIDRVAIYTQSLDEPYSLTVDYLIGYGGDGDISPTPEEEELMSHIPADWQPHCFDAFASVHATGWTADILCQTSLIEGALTDYAEYTSFDTKANMDAYYQYVVDQYFVAESGLNCDAGAHMGGYTIAGETAGKLMCAEHPLGGTILYWTYDDLLILSQLDDDVGSYPDMYADWLNAGPN